MALSPYTITTSDPFDLDSVLVWSTDKESSLIRTSKTAWADALKGIIAPGLEHFFTPDKDALRNKTVHGFLGDLTKTCSIIVMPSAACPHGCNQEKYGDYCGQVHDNQRLSPNDIMRVEAMVCSALEKDYDRIALGFFGGEPLTNWRAIVGIMQHAKKCAASVGRSSHVTGTLTTSGFLLTPRLHTILLQSGIEHVEVTLDGPEYQHDARRPLRDGRPSFRTILQNLKEILSQDDFGQISIRMNVDSRNIDSIDELIDQLSSDGILPKATFYISPVRDWGAENAGKKYSSMPAFAQAELRVLRKLSYLGQRVVLLPSVRKRTCVSLSENPAVVAPNGEEYYCTEIPLTEKNGAAKTSWLDIDVEEWRKRLTLEQSLPCVTCSLLPVCGGACPKEWLKGNEPCPSIKWNVKGRMALFTAFHPNEVFAV